MCVCVCVCVRVCVCVCVRERESQSSHHIQVLVSHSAMSLPVNMRSVQEVKCSNEFVKQLPRGVSGISAAHCFSGLLIVISHFYGRQVSLRASGLAGCSSSAAMLFYLRNVLMCVMIAVQLAQSSYCQ